ncbi:MAG TPA: CpsB/CapC family capsule biosynthesis tyrosine phosphatase [Solirubrobacter sp.]
MIDLHCHVLPGIDDGPPTIEAALELAREAERDGITTIAATPHIHPAYPTNDAALVWARIVALQPRLDAAGIAVKLVPGGEVDALRALELDDEELRALHLGGGPWLLLECPLSSVAAPAFIPTAKALARRGHNLLLAHPERSPVFLRQPERLDELVNEDGMLAQVTAGSLSGQFGRTVRELAHRLVATRSVHVVASDGHGAHRPATIARELEQAGIDPQLTAWLAHDVPKAILAGTQPPAAPDAHRRRRRLFGR